MSATIRRAAFLAHRDQRRQRQAYARPTFWAGFNTSGVGNLDPSLTINSQTETPVFRYNGLDAADPTLPAWTYGDTLTLAGSGSDPTFDTGAPLLGAEDGSFQGAGGTAFQASGNSLGDITTEDVVLEFVGTVPTSAHTTIPRIAAHRALGTGWVFYRTTSNNAALYFSDGTNSAQVSSAVLVQQAWYHIIIFVDRSGSAQIYINGSASGSAVSFSSVGSITVAQPLTLCAESDLSNDGDGHVAYLAMWAAASWLDTHLQTTVAQERFRRLVGIWPQVADGTADPTVAQRATTAHLDKTEGSARKLYLVGKHWLRCCSRDDSQGVAVSGYLAEEAATNTCLRSQEFGTSPWAAVQCSISADALAAPDGAQTADTIVEDVSFTSSSCDVRQFISIVNTTKYVFSCWLKKSGRSWVRLLAAQATFAYAFYDIDTGATGTTSNVTDVGIEDWGNGWFRCWMKFTGDQSASTGFTIAPAEGDNDAVYDNLGSDSIHLWGAQLETAVDYPTSYVPTTSAAATRNKDELRYKGDDGNLGGAGSDQVGSMSAVQLLGDQDAATSGLVLSLSDGGSSADRISLYGRHTSDNALLEIAATGGSSASEQGTTDVDDGKVHHVGAAWITDNGRLLVDGSDEGKDTDVDIPDNLDRIDVGQYITGSNQLQGLISQLKIWRHE